MSSPEALEHAAATRRVFDLLVRRYGAESSETTWGQAETLATHALGDVLARLQAAEQALRDWESRDHDGDPPISIERGNTRDGNLEVLVEGLTYEQTDRIEDFIEAVLRALEGAAE